MRSMGILPMFFVFFCIFPAKLVLDPIGERESILFLFCFAFTGNG